MPQCPRCEQAVEAQDVFCRRCGAQLQGGEQRQSFMDDMAAVYQRRLKDAKNDPDALFNIGLAMLYSNRPAEAVESFQRVVELQPDFVDARVKLGFCLWQAGQREQALEQVEQALSQAPDNKRAQDLRAQMREQLKL